MTRKVSPLKLELVRRGMRQVDVAEKAYLSESRLSRILSGRCRPRDYERKNLAAALGVKTEDLEV